MVNNTITIMGFNLAAIIGFMICAWIFSLILKDASIADIFWGLGFVLIAWMTFFRAEGYFFRKLLIALLVSIWGLRLAIYIGLRNRGKGEDRRYQTWRNQYGKNYWWVSLFTVFGLQGLLLWAISLVVQAGQLASKPAELGWLEGVGFLIWAIGFVFEATADFQLYRFKADPGNRGKVMDRGLWAYTRHPNYFGESLIWWGLFLIALSTPHGIWTIISPVIITFLLLRVSGVSLLEKTIVEKRPAYRAYKEKTSAFFPWFPGRKKT